MFYFLLFGISILFANGKAQDLQLSSDHTHHCAESNHMQKNGSACPCTMDMEHGGNLNYMMHMINTNNIKEFLIFTAVGTAIAFVWRKYSNRIGKHDISLVNTDVSGKTPEQIIALMLLNMPEWEGNWELLASKVKDMVPQEFLDANVLNSNLQPIDNWPPQLRASLVQTVNFLQTKIAQDTGLSGSELKKAVLNVLEQPFKNWVEEFFTIYAKHEKK